MMKLMVSVMIINPSDERQNTGGLTIGGMIMMVVALMI